VYVKKNDYVLAFDDTSGVSCVKYQL